MKVLKTDSGWLGELIDLAHRKVMQWTPESKRYHRIHDSLRGDTSDQVLDLLRCNDGCAFTAEKIADHLNIPASELDMLKSMLGRLVREERIRCMEEFYAQKGVSDGKIR